MCLIRHVLVADFIYTGVTGVMEPVADTTTSARNAVILSIRSHPWHMIFLIRLL